MSVFLKTQIFEEKFTIILLEDNLLSFHWSDYVNLTLYT